ncbi:hypothetical protein GQ44DRAFT_768188 [Phaeosphaeriaceae sp. PMI808]|nr:hypothetical protein GQ44DRAFT_768188 [Phaeosphaeriaceae sp. PMI808]
MPHFLSPDYTPRRLSSSSFSSSFSSAKSAGLPGDEYIHLIKAQRRLRLEDHFSSPKASLPRPFQSPSSPYRNKGLSQSHRCDISEVRSATRTAFRSNFDFNADNCERSRSGQSEYEDSRGWTNIDAASRDGAIPQKYIDNFNRRWHEEDEDNDADQYLADCTPNASWRMHAKLYTDMPGHRTLRERRCFDKENSSIYIQLPAQPKCRPTSQFSFDEDEPVRSRGLRNVFRR